MDTSALSFAFSAVFTPINMLVILGGTILGIFIGAMPGMSSPSCVKQLTTFFLNFFLPLHYTSFRLNYHRKLIHLLSCFCC